MNEEQTSISPEFGAALVKLQSKLKAPPKNKTAKINANFSYSYADLADIIESIKGPMAECGLAIIQPVIFMGSALAVRTILVHDSGEFMSWDFVLPTLGGQNVMQSMGSAITYARRYSLQCALGIAADDDDDAVQTSAPVYKAGTVGLAGPTSKSVLADSDIPAKSIMTTPPTPVIGSTAPPKCVCGSNMYVSKFNANELYCMKCKAKRPINTPAQGNFDDSDDKHL